MKNSNEKPPIMTKVNSLWQYLRPGTEKESISRKLTRYSIVFLICVILILVGSYFDYRSNNSINLYTFWAGILYCYITKIFYQKGV